ncbi:Sphingomyelin phosphodiesterase [Aphelenchoides besseyi]|nr:Sphingomyelin phosphodiesterase [Aphelenchoides besseyi]
MRFLVLLLLFSSAFGLPIQNVKHEEDGLFCTFCKDAVGLAETIFGSNIINECLPDFIIFMCETLGIQSQNVCKGIVGNFQDVFLYVLNEILKEPVDVCGILLTSCDTPNNPLDSNWTTYIPPNKPPYEKDYPPKVGQYPDLRVLQIADVHIDLKYAVGSEVECGEPQCCRMPKQSELNGNSTVRNVKEPAGYWGSVGNCDAPIWMFESMLKHANETQDRIDYIVVSGDLESHADWEYSEDGHTKIINKVTELLQEYFPNTRVLFCIGNHEGVPINIIGTHSVPQRFQPTWLYKAMADAFSPNWLGDEEKQIMDVIQQKYAMDCDSFL